jgi:hypothetical protein
MPESFLAQCRGCGRGEFLNKEGVCTHCPDGYYQSQDNHFDDNPPVTECKVCPVGHYAPKILDIGHFESVPKYFHTACDLATIIGNHKECSVNYGWHSNSEFML